MISGWIVFRKTVRVRFRTLLLYSIGVALSAATILTVTLLTGMASAGVDRELDRVLLNGVQVRASSLSAAVLEDAVRDAAASLTYEPMPVCVAAGTAQGRPCAVWGVASCGADRFSLRFCAGRFFDRREEDAAARVCVIGERMAAALFGTRQIIGAPLRLSVGGVDEIFRVVGVYDDGTAARMGYSGAETVYLPHTVPQVGGSVETTYWLAAQDGLGEAVVRLRERLGSACQFVDHVGQRRQIRHAFDLVAGILTLISSVSLMVAAFSLLVITRIRVMSHVREIGLKKSIGASTADLLWEYVFEAGGIALIGSLIGAALTGALCLVLRAAGYEVCYPWLTVPAVTLAAVILSALFCLIPAGWAARLPPAQTLRRDG